MARLRLILEYDGARFRGWQLQAEGDTVQGALEAAIEQLTGERSRVIGAGRTDAGVHARGQVAHCDVPDRRGPQSWLRALNAVLPAGIAVLRADRVPPEFHARRDALRKRYRYRILNRGVPSPLRAAQTWQVRARLDLEAMQRAAALLIGHHDFAAFRGAPGGPPPHETTLRTLDRLELRRAGDEVELWAEGRSFLRYMVRNLTGTLVEVGLGRRPAGDVARILASRDRAQAGATAPAQGLCLEAVEYALEARCAPGEGQAPRVARQGELA